MLTLGKSKNTLFYWAGHTLFPIGSCAIGLSATRLDSLLWSGLVPIVTFTFLGLGMGLFLKRYFNFKEASPHKSAFSIFLMGALWGFITILYFSTFQGDWLGLALLKSFVFPVFFTSHFLSGVLYEWALQTALKK